MQLTRALQWLHFAVAVAVMAAMGWNATAQTASPAGKNKAPTASITSPANPSTFPQGAPITLTATASDVDGSVTGVQYFDGATFISPFLASAPYTFVWTNAAPGTHNNVTAKATDNANATGTSSPITIIVQPNSPPTVAITSPSAGSVFAAPAVIPITATASDTNGSVSQVQFLHDGVAIGQPVTTAPYAVTWTGVPVGTYQLTAQATDNQGAVTTSAPVSISVGAPPLVVMTSPDNCTTVSPPASVTLAADAIDLDGWITAVDFLDGTTLIGTATRLPYAVTFSNVAQGTHTLTARATNNLGITATSTAITLNCAAPNTPPTVNITAPAPDSTFRAGATVTITANANDPDGTVSEVKFYRSGNFIASSNGPVFSVPWTNIPAGDWQLTAIATDNGGATSNPSQPVHVIVQPNAAPTAHLTAPATGASYRAPATVSFTATANDSDGTVQQVDYLLNGNVVATSNTSSSSYAATATGVAAGSYDVKARATDNDGATGISPETVTINVAANALPIVTINSPANGAAITAPADVPITATATDSDGTIAKVEFFGDGVLLATVTSPPYNATWFNVPLGSNRQIAVRATDNDGGATTALRSINVTGIRSEITAPPNGSTYVGPAAFDLVTKLAASSGLLTKVEFYDGSALLTSFDISPPGNPINFTLQLSAIGPGTHVYTAKVFDNSSRVATSPPITIVVTAPPNPPVVSLTSPQPNAFYLAPANVTLSADVTPGANPVQKVEFFNGANLIATVNSPPYTYAWNNVAAGDYVISAKATDTANIQGTSNAVAVSVAAAPSVTVDAGIDGSTVADDHMIVTGIVRTLPNSSVTVNGVPGEIDFSGHFVVNEVPLAVGANSLVVTVKTMDGDSGSQTITVNRTGLNPINLKASAYGGMAPFTVKFVWENRGNVAVKKVEMDFSGSQGLQDVTAFGSTIQVSYTGEGNYFPRLVVTDMQDRQYVTRVALVVSSAANMNALLRGALDTMMVRLSANDVTRAVNSLTPGTADEFKDDFNAMAQAGLLTQAVQQFGTVLEGTFGNRMAEFLLIRANADGTRSAFRLNFIKSPDGIWRIDGM